MYFHTLFSLAILSTFEVGIASTTGVGKTCFGDKQQTEAALDRLGGLVSCATNKSVNNCPDKTTNPLARDLTRGVALDAGKQVTRLAWDNSVEGEIAATARVKSAEGRIFMDQKIKSFLSKNPELQKMAEAVSPAQMDNQDKLLKAIGVSMKTNSVSGPYIYRSDKFTDDTMAAIWKYARGYALDADDIGELIPDLKNAAEYLAKMRAATSPQQLDAAIKAFNATTGTKIEPTKPALTGIIQKSSFNASKAATVTETKSVIGRRVAGKFVPIVAVPVAAYVGCKMTSGSPDCSKDSVQSLVDIGMFFTTTRRTGCDERYSEYEEIDSDCKRKSGWTQGLRNFLVDLNDEQQQKELMEFNPLCLTLQNLYRHSFPTIGSVSKCSATSVEFSLKDSESNEPRRILTNFNSQGAIVGLKNYSSDINYWEMSWDSTGALNAMWNITGRTKSPYFTSSKNQSSGSRSTKGRGFSNDLEKTDEVYFKSSSQILLSQELQKCCSNIEASGTDCLAQINNTTNTYFGQSSSPSIQGGHNDNR